MRVYNWLLNKDVVLEFMSASGEEGPEISGIVADADQEAVALSLPAGSTYVIPWNAIRFVHVQEPYKPAP